MNTTKKSGRQVPTFYCQNLLFDIWYVALGVSYWLKYCYGWHFYSSNCTINNLCRIDNMNLNTDIPLFCQRNKTVPIIMFRFVCGGYGIVFFHAVILSLFGFPSDIKICHFKASGRKRRKELKRSIFGCLTEGWVDDSRYNFFDKLRYIGCCYPIR